MTVALGSVLASVATSSPVAWTEGALVQLLLTTLQFISAWTATRFTGFRRMLTPQPTVLLRDGHLLTEALLRQRIDEHGLCAAVRSGGSDALESVALVVQERDGTLSVIARSALGSGSALKGAPFTTPQARIPG